MLAEYPALDPGRNAMHGKRFKAGENENMLREAEVPLRKGAKMPDLASIAGLV